jgi:hypothetical protein
MVITAGSEQGDVESLRFEMGVVVMASKERLKRAKVKF